FQTDSLGMTEAYSNLARVYEDSMEVDYQKWMVYLLSLMLRHGHIPRNILDLGGGTGNLILPLAPRRYDITVVDLSLSLIEEAKFKANKEGFDLSFLSQDMRDLKLGSEQFTTVISACDVLNYLTCPKDLSTAFNQVRQVLEPGGFWLFDLNSAHKLQEI